MGMVTAANFRSQLVDILNYHTIVLPSGEKLGTNKYYKTKHGGTIMFDNSKVMSGSQMDNGLPVSEITQVYNQENGTAYAIDHVIQAPHKSVLEVLDNDPRFTEFMELCTDFAMDSIMAFASDRLVEVNTVTRKKRMESYHTFAAKNGLTDNVNYFNSYNYTVYVPDNVAMQKAYERGLPKWSDVKVIFDQYNERLEREKLGTSISDEVQAARDKALAMGEEINAFIRYHFQDNSVCADNVIEGGTYPTACSDTLGIREKLTVSGSDGKLKVTDKRGQEIIVDNSNTSKMVNQLARDYVLNKRTHVINTSSFAVVHQISTPLCTHEDTDRYDGVWTGSGARQRLKDFRRLYETYLYKRYDRENETISE
jgi:uncharacterized surface protein with fasciclin (FAS1) repeats